MTRIFLIANPISGRGAGERAIPQIEQALRGRGADFDLARTQRPWHAAELARQAVADRYDLVAGVGGDGTANEVLNGLLLAQEAGLGEAAMGMIAVGRGNDFAYGMGIPAGVEAGCQTLLGGQRRRVDVGWVSGGDYPQGRYFGNGVGIGFDAVVGFESVKLKRLHGFPSYIVAALKTIFLYFRAPLVRLEFDGQVITRPLLLVSIMNGRRMGGGFTMAPSARADDGLFDLCIAEQMSPWRILRLIPHFFKGTQGTQPGIRMGQAARITVTAQDGPLPAQTDGEIFSTEGRKIEVELIPSRIEVICRGEGG